MGLIFRGVPSQVSVEMGVKRDWILQRLVFVAIKITYSITTERGGKFAQDEVTNLLRISIVSLNQI